MTAEQLTQKVRDAGQGIPLDDWIEMLETIIDDLQTDLDAARHDEG